MYVICIFNKDSLSYLVFTCKSNSDCRGNGYCKREFHLEVKRVVGVCKCDPNYNYALDCSIYGCKYHLTACFTLFKIRRWVAAHMFVLSHFRTCDVRAEVCAERFLELCVRCECVWLLFGRAMCHHTFAHF